MDASSVGSPEPAAGGGHPGELHEGPTSQRLNWLRAGVLGANDGIVSTAGLVVGVAGASGSRTAVFIAGMAGLVAGALSMAGGEYVSVSTQRDSEEALLARERWELAEMPEEELAELTDLYRDRGLSDRLARQVAEELTERDALAAHAEVELGIDPDDLVSPVAAALSSFVAFALGAALPLVAIVVPPPATRVPITMAAVTVALVATGIVSARLGVAPVRPAVIRNVVVGIAAMALTWVVGEAIGDLGPLSLAVGALAGGG